jgi:hypothetical protein
MAVLDAHLNAALRNAWIDVDPRSWKIRNDVTIHVGLGSGGKAQQFCSSVATREMLPMSMDRRHPEGSTAPARTGCGIFTPMGSVKDGSARVQRTIL